MIVNQRAHAFAVEIDTTAESLPNGRVESGQLPFHDGLVFRFLRDAQGEGIAHPLTEVPTAR